MSPPSPPPTSGALDSALDSFRRQWMSDLHSRTTVPASATRPSPTFSHPPIHPDSSVASSSANRKLATVEPPLSLPSRRDSTSMSSSTAADNKVPSAVGDESALDFYERAVEKEARGKLGESVALYRRAFRLDERVDRLYKEKHYPFATNTVRPSRPDAAGSSPATAAAAPLQPYDELIAGFADIAITVAEPELEGDPPLPCPLATLPDEILLRILGDVALTDVGDFVRLAQVCPRFAYLVATEQTVWRRVCEGPEYGFAAMAYGWKCGLDWEPLEGRPVPPPPLMLSPAYPSWVAMFRSRPRIRFNGCYISTVNYQRPGQASPTATAWNSPVHIVTYYRFLRFFRDGSAISLLTTSEPADVVSHLTREQLQLHRRREEQPHHHHHHHHNHSHSHSHSHNQNHSNHNRTGEGAGASGAVMQIALRGRWRLGVPGQRPDEDMLAGIGIGSGSGEYESEQHLVVETEGVGPKYTYRMDLAMATAGRAARNNKLVWRHFCSYNSLTDDWAEFSLRHYRPFIFSRVKCYGRYGE